MSIVENIAELRQRVGTAARRSGRNSQDIELMAVTKTVAPDRIREAYEHGIRLFGENRVQEFEAKTDALHDLVDARWHMIGHLQSNKAVKATELFNAVESIDSLRLAQKLNTAASQQGKTVPVLIEINIGGEQAKSGVQPDSEDLEQLLRAAPDLPHLSFQGLMTVPPYGEDPEQSRLFFRRMRELATEIQKRQLPNVEMKTLSMGMSHDFEVAIEEGTTRIRIGTAIFGERKLQRSNA
ncbi:MAG: YggS family pyridoxal phosphate-dependent enzyme [Acidobacteria bacterium]|nr:MAG: YggS family pyridoxal phosphate-dependent enzyme [Acidobacteriota bacterium]